MNKKFEHNTVLYVILYPLTLLFALWVRQKKKKAQGERIEYYAWFYDKFSKSARQVREGAGKWPALEALYNWKAHYGFCGFLERFWMNLRSAQAVRNRKKIVVEILRKDALQMIQNNGETRILSIACGSAQSVFEAVQGIENVHILAIDMDKTAIECSQKLAKLYGIEKIEWRYGNVLSPATTANGFKPNIVEVVGLFDYLSDKAIVGLLQRISKLAQPGSVLVTAHIHPNPEQSIVQDIVDWDMIYRPLNHFRQLVCKGGFEQAAYYTEPHKIFTVVRGETRLH